MPKDIQLVRKIRGEVLIYFLTYEIKNLFRQRQCHQLHRFIKTEECMTQKPEQLALELRFIK
jgi:hypothetical protein